MVSHHKGHIPQKHTKRKRRSIKYDVFGDEEIRGDTHTDNNIHHDDSLHFEEEIEGSQKNNSKCRLV